MIASSQARLAREERVFSRSAASLAALLAEETGTDLDDAEPWVAASAMIGVQRTLIAYVHRHLDATQLADEVRARGERALALLERGLGSYALKETPLI